LSNNKPTILCDCDIPYLGDWLANYCQLESYAAGGLTPVQLQGADGLIVRSVTSVDAALLKNSPCRWVGSVTAGTNHLDFPSLAVAGIQCDYAPGANAPAVCEYVLSALFLAKDRGHVSPRSRIAVIGVGEVGSRVVAACVQLGFSVVAYDPPRQEREAGFQSASWDDVLSCDVAIVCASYTPSSHELINAGALTQWGSLRVLINAARGEIVDYSSAFARSDSFSPVIARSEATKQSIYTSLDVWPNEPSIDPVFVAQADIATPHIAGYSQQSKWRLSAMIYQACSDFFALSVQQLACPNSVRTVNWSDQVGLEQLSQQMKIAIAQDSSPASFHALRRGYPLRDETDLSVTD
jgi:erythronate-4-phosphate dehydrogenase